MGGYDTNLTTAELQKQLNEQIEILAHLVAERDRLIAEAKTEQNKLRAFNDHEKIDIIKKKISAIVN